MDCPVCKDPMVVLELEAVEIDHCISCSGIWLDAGELELLLDSTAKKDEILSSFRIFKQTKEKKRVCPICLKKMEKVSCVRDEEVLIDRCEKGDGIWFDKGELREIIRKASLDKENRVLNLLQDMFQSR